MKRLVKRMLHRIGLDLTRFPPRISFDPATDNIIGIVSPYTMTHPERVNALIRAVTYIAQHDIPGAIVECGVWRGGSMMAVAHTLLALNKADRDLYLFDTFEGMTEPGLDDVKLDGVPAVKALAGIQSTGETVGDWLRASLEEVQGNLATTGYPRHLVHFVKGKVQETIPVFAPEIIAILRLDTDWYDSTHHELEHLMPRLTDGGVLIVDDYGDWAGARKATDEYLAKTGEKILLNRIASMALGVRWKSEARTT
jgi:O-methyltransferase